MSFVSTYRKQNNISFNHNNEIRRLLNSSYNRDNRNRFINRRNEMSFKESLRLMILQISNLKRKIIAVEKCFKVSIFIFDFLILYYLFIIFLFN